MKAPTEILTTANYDIFKTIKGNRLIHGNHLNRLIKSMKVEYIPVPILVNSKYEVIDGQHRLAACKQLGFPVSYIKGNGYGLKEVQALNSVSRTWGGSDHSVSRALSGNENYQMFLDFKEKYGFGQYESILLLSQGHASVKSNEGFRLGTFVVKSLKWAETAAERIYQVQGFYPGFKRRSFVLAMITLFNNKNFDHAVFISKLKFNSQQMVDCVGTEQYIQLIEKIYNYRTREKIRFF